ncbi:uncharacterized protein LOC119080795 [Bradysia coprophila]|uniref:uncharacterized protein LOC119080795 n=1 Tax=Bradysia coprophila TaxID=38358 RepID=UPI00187D7A2D|nr:uncharacterized protein LOC119080795 [Bradysia coprophila]
MLHLLILTLTSIGLVTGDTNCPGFSNYLNNVTLLNELNGEYLVVFTTSAYVLNCERISWSLDENNNPTAYLKDSTGCCRQITKFDESNQDYYQHYITPLSVCTRLKSTENVAKKLVASVGTRTELCLVIYICHSSRYGLLIVCRQPPQPSLLFSLHQTLNNLFSLLVPIPVLRTVNQNNCVFPHDCYF